MSATPKQLRAAEARRKRAAAQAEQALLERDRIIRELIAIGHTHTEVWRMLGGGTEQDGVITRARIGQIAHGVAKVGGTS